ncbi:MAG: metal-dependent phosphohydrolase [Cyanobacteria bacterium QH_9_48_43]|jgi:DICT domain-containing protein|nr:MAG: metal-dependent phosphohydrolase [Cyanobacteria bacterium QH_9_48_43]PSO82156.1 MAG: metal-dependent phosphohydrolase [Cyanobacteria bacterium QS_5_48_63]PSO91562.1 MAG: metal-dependent phosphohydrolase [Cyanobacteria bacterium QS_6_48_18]PSP04321.1 MAG: metal-dependent phosphohydrolase [Cyanobacteria bacterium SW_12_48_29]PSP11778.1 MAG: metal-dependent phosphohydrolase [Cyanobacteria bacterium SW_11_48_12]PSP12112.1 MAG: metal-dependent phosphohydrolase [Cyanobacteria bacterium SW_10
MLEGSILKKLYANHQNGKKPLNLGVYYKNTLVALCHALEDFILESDSEPLIISVFQKGKWYMQEAERYGEIAQKASQVAILGTSDSGFAEHPTGEMLNVSLVSMEANDPLTREWHLIILSPTYTAMVLCQELSESDYGNLGQPSNDLERKFYGFWTFEPELVWETAELVIAHIGSYDRELQEALTAKKGEMTVSFGFQEQEDLGEVVWRVVDYLQDTQQNISQPSEASYLPSSEALDNNLVSNEIQAFLRMAQLTDQVDVTNPNAAAEVTALAETMAHLLDLPAWQQKRLRLASWLHRLVQSMGTTAVSSPETAASCALSCTLDPGVQALRTRPELRAIAEIITHQTERWDGTGYPGGLAYDDIPLESRILALVADFQWQVNNIRLYQPAENDPSPSREETFSQALAECQAEANQAFDPKLIETLGLVVMGMQQGMDLQTSQPNITSGMWLLDSPTDQEAQLSASSQQT